MEELRARKEALDRGAEEATAIRVPEEQAENPFFSTLKQCGLPLLCSTM